MSAVLFLSGQTMGDALGGIGRSFASLFDELGYDFVEINFQDAGASDLLNRTVRESGVEFAFSFVGMGADLIGTLSDGTSGNLWESLGIPFISLYGDTPAYFFDRHVMPSGLCAGLYAFPEHYELRKLLPGINGLLGVSPPGAMDSVSKNSVDFKIKERGRLLFLKNGNDPEALVTQWRDALRDSTFVMLTDIASSLASRIATDPGNRIDAVVTEYFENRGMFVGAATKLRLFFVAQLDDYLRRVKSNLLARTLMDFPIDMFGYNWEHLDFSGKPINFTPGGDYTRSAPMIMKSLGLIDMSPNTTFQPHERPLRAFGMFTLCLTNEQEFFRKNVDGSERFSFAFDVDSIRAKVADVIAHPKRYVEVGIDAAEDFRSKFPRLRFAEFLVEVAATLRLAAGPRPAALQPYFAWPPSRL